MTEKTAYLFILKSISWPNFNYFNKLWILMSGNGLGKISKRNIKENKEMNTTQQTTERKQSDILLAWDAPGHVISNMSNCLSQSQMKPESQNISLSRD